jgi:hypothetical protein
MAIYGGLKPWKAIKSARIYQISDTYNQSLFRGDPICRADTGYVQQWTTSVAQSPTIPMVGVALAFYDATMNPIKYWLASTPGKGYVLVADDPNQEFIVAEDCDTVQLAQADVFANLDIVLGTGDAVTGRSAALLDSNSYVSDPTLATLGFRLVGLAPLYGNTEYNATTCPSPKWIVTINIHNLTTLAGV